MSHYDYEVSAKLERMDWPFHALIMTAMRQADSENAVRLRTQWPDIWAELEARYNAPGGLLDDEELGSGAQFGRVT